MQRLCLLLVGKLKFLQQLHPQAVIGHLCIRKVSPSRHEVIYYWPHCFMYECADVFFVSVEASDVSEGEHDHW